MTPLVRKRTEINHELGREAIITNHSKTGSKASMPPHCLSPSNSYSCWSLLLFTCRLFYLLLHVQSLHVSERMAANNSGSCPYSLLSKRKRFLSTSNCKILEKNSDWLSLVDMHTSVNNCPDGRGTVIGSA